MKSSSTVSIRVLTLTEAIARSRRMTGPIVLGPAKPGLIQGMPDQGPVAVNSIEIDTPPSPEELELLAHQDRFLALQISREEPQKFVLHVGSRDSFALPHLDREDTLVVGTPHQDLPENSFPRLVHAENYLLWGCLSSWHIATPQFLIRVENRFYGGPNSTINTKPGEIMLHAKFLGAKREHPVRYPFNGDEQYSNPGLFYAEAIYDIRHAYPNAIDPNGSLVIDGLPRIGSRSAKAKVYLLTWDDFKEACAARKSLLAQWD